MNMVMRTAETYDFSEDWFSNHIPSWTRILERIQPRRVLEIGCYEGRSTSFIIEACSAYGPLSLHCVDTWQGSTDLSPERMRGVERRFDDNVDLAIRRASALVQLTKLKTSSRAALSTMIAGSSDPFDLIYVDGSHTAPDVLLDAVLAFQVVRVGGVMIFDDYLWSQELPLYADPLNTPKLAIDTFAAIYARKVRVLPDFPNAQCYLEKIAA